MDRRVMFFLILLFLVSMPLAVADAQLNNPGSGVPSKIVNCDGPDCDFNALISLAQTILNFIVGISVVIAAVMFAYAGWLYVSDSGNQQNVQKAHGVFGAVVIGIVIVLVAWLLVDTLLKALTGKGFRERGEAPIEKILTERPHSDIVSRL